MTYGPPTMTAAEYAAYVARRNAATAKRGATPPSMADDATDAPESHLRDSKEAPIQAGFEKWLEHRGYWHRRKKWLRAGKPPRGWQIHLNRCEANPYLLDVLLLGNDGRYLEIELKRTRGGRVSWQQKAIMDANPESTRLARDIETATADIIEWEGETE